MATYVLVPGGWHGGWVYDNVAERLRRRGHRVFPLTLTGLNGDAVAANLDTHIQDVVGLLEADELQDVVLCGHSYGGMVITGAADRASERIARLVYIDAYVPRDGDSCWSLTTEAFRALFIEGVGRDGLFVNPSPRSDSRAAAHPLPSLVQRIRLRGDWERVPRRDFIYLTGWRGTPFAGLYERLSRDSSWRVCTMPTSHNVMAEAPEELAQILGSGTWFGTPVS